MTITNLSYAFGKPCTHATIKQTPDDFFVDEQLGFSLTGEGEHLFVHIAKKQLTTAEVIERICKAFSLKKSHVSYAGLKDKYAHTKQWLSLHLPGLPDPNLSCIECPNLKILQSTRHQKKLSIGALQGNYFEIQLRDIKGDEADILSRISQVKNKGVPNYFGAQRFGNEGSTIQGAEAFLLANKRCKSRHLKGLFYSAARALLFNQILSLRVETGTWPQPVLGDLMMLSGTNSVFQLQDMTDNIIARVNSKDIFPASVLWGAGKLSIDDKALTLLNRSLDGYENWCQALVKHGLKMAYRALVLYPERLTYSANRLCFYLPKGCYATSVLRELCLLD